MSLALKQTIGFMLFLCLFAPLLHGQTPAEDRPEVFKAPVLTPQETEHLKVEKRSREARTLFALGVMRHRGDRWLEAVTLLERVVKLEPDAAEAYRALIPLYLALAREEDALDACRKVLQLDPGDASAAYQLAKLQKADGKPREAIAALRSVAEIDRSKEQPELLYFILSDLAELQEKCADFGGAAKNYRRLANLLLDERARLIGSETLDPQEHAIATARAYERTGRCLLNTGEFSGAIEAFTKAADLLKKNPDADIRLKAVRLNWNLAEVFIKQEKWNAALGCLDEYLEHKPVDPEPYEKKIAVLRSLNRKNEILPSLRKYAGRLPDVIAIQLLYARELAMNSDMRAQAESFYLALSERFANAEVYRGLFRFYQTGDQMIEVLDLIDKTFAALDRKDEVEPESLERARDRGRAMLQVLRSEPGLVASLLHVALQELREVKARKIDTWHLLAALAARTNQLETAETLFRQCLERAPVRLEATVYGSLLGVLWQQKKYDAVIAVCKAALYGPRKAAATNQLLFHRNMALALSEQGKVDDALAEIDRSIKLAIEPVKVLEKCRKARILAAAERYDSAIEECTTMLKELSAPAEIKQVRHTMALIYTFKGEHGQSEAQLLKILEDDPNDAGANNDLGYQWADRNRHLDEAEKMIRKAIEIEQMQRRDDPDDESDNAAYLDSLGWVLFRKGKLEEAREWLEKAATFHLGADDPTVWDHLGDVYHKLKQPEKAKRAWQTAIKLYDNDRRSKKEGRQDEAKRKLKAME